MVTMTISVPDDTGQEFRAIVKEKYGEGKGILGKAVAEAMALWVQKKGDKIIAHRQHLLLRNAPKAAPYVFKRSDAYD